MPLSTGQLIAAAVQDAWALVGEFTNRTRLIDHIIDLGHGFRRVRMFDIIGNIWERAHAPSLSGPEFRFDRAPTEYMAEMVWRRDERFGVFGDAIYRDEFGNLERHRTVFWTDNYSTAQEYEQEWGQAVAEQNRYPNLDYVGFELDQVWHKKHSDYGHPMLQEL